MWDRIEVTVRDKAGNVSTGWVLCVPTPFGLSNDVKVYWEEAPAATLSKRHDLLLDD
jgi:hypothetical protein